MLLGVCPLSNLSLLSLSYVFINFLFLCYAVSLIGVSSLRCFLILYFYTEKSKQKESWIAPPL